MRAGSGSGRGGETDEAAPAKAPAIHRAKASSDCDQFDGVGPEARPREWLAQSSVVVLDLQVVLGVHGVVWVRLDEGDPLWCKQVADAPEQSFGVAADADVLVQEQDVLPSALAGKGLEHRALKNGCTCRARHGDRPWCDIDAESGKPPLHQCGNETSRPAPHVQRGAGAACDQVLVDRVHPAAIPVQVERLAGAVAVD